MTPSLTPHTLLSSTDAKMTVGWPDTRASLNRTRRAITIKLLPVRVMSPLCCSPLLLLCSLIPTKEPTTCSGFSELPF